MFNQTNDEVIDLVDFHLNTFFRSIPFESSGSSQLTIRVENDLRSDIDAVCKFLCITRNSFINDVLEIAARKAISRIEDNPYLSNMHVNEMSVSELAKANRASSVDLEKA
jgi:hypothetical protein